MSRATLVGLAVATLAGLLLLAGLRPPGRSLAGDEGTYTAMVESLALDRDLRFDERDRARVTAPGPAGRDTVILQRTSRGIAYSKPILYPLLAAPLYPLLGGSSLVALNGVALALALWLAFQSLRRLGEPRHAALTLLTFAGAGSLLCLLAWRMSDALQVAMAAAGLALALRCGPAGGGASRVLSPLAPWSGGALLGGLVTLRYPNAVLAIAAVAALAVQRRFRAAAGVALTAALAFGLLSGLQLAVGGAANPYKAVRASFHPGTGYPVGSEPAATDYEFDVMTKTARIFVRPAWSPRETGYAALYFVVGRHTGLLAYLPAALVLAWGAARRPDRASSCLLGAAGLLALFYLVWLPTNYFGGAAFVGNRYFVVAYPALLLALRRLPSPRSLALAWVLAALALASAVLSISGPGRGDAGTQSHAYAGLFRWLPYESVARDIEGRRDRYWSDEFLRFVDPFARVAEHGLTLPTSGPPAELLVATPREHGVLRFLVRTSAPAVELTLSDWAGDRRVLLEESPAAPGSGARGLVEVEAGAAWRRHPFWWTEGEIWRAHAVRLGARAPQGGAERVGLAYLGPYRPATKFYRGELVEGSLPEEVIAGSRSSLVLTLRNTGMRFWAADDAVPVHLAYRLDRGAGTEPPLPPPDRLEAIPGRVERGDQVRIELPVAWPQEPGEWLLRVDLVLAGALWFEEIGGSPVAESRLRVVPPEAVRAAVPVLRLSDA